MTADARTPEEIARGLTKALRFAVADLARSPCVGITSGHPPTGFVLSQAAARLYKLRLADKSIRRWDNAPIWRLTPLGRAVAAILKETDHDR